MSFAAATHLASGFQEPVFDSQRAFRAAMDALANPGQIKPAGRGLDAAPLPAAAAALVFSLCDYETSLYLSPSLATKSGVVDYLRFHTDAVLVSEPSAATFALLDLAADTLDLSAFAQGTPEYPDRSTTIIAITDSLTSGAQLTLTGPGIQSSINLHVTRLPAEFTTQWRANRTRFPLGVDMLFATGDAVIGLPRSARIAGEAS
ncbi:MAG: phosphonate C-P lyase system protein PhnH [Beijerinckiaceae bacterium]